MMVKHFSWNWIVSCIFFLLDLIDTNLATQNQQSESTVPWRYHFAVRCCLAITPRWRPRYLQQSWSAAWACHWASERGSFQSPRAKKQPGIALTSEKYWGWIGVKQGSYSAVGETGRNLLMSCNMTTSADITPALGGEPLPCRADN